MKRLASIVKWVWLAMAAITAVEAYIAYTQQGLGQDFYIMVAGFVISIVMYTLRRKTEHIYNK